MSDTLLRNCLERFERNLARLEFSLYIMISSDITMILSLSNLECRHLSQFYNIVFSSDFALQIPVFATLKLEQKRTLLNEHMTTAGNGYIWLKTVNSKIADFPLKAITLVTHFVSYFSAPDALRWILQSHCRSCRRHVTKMGSWHWPRCWTALMLQFGSSPSVRPYLCKTLWTYAVNKYLWFVPIHPWVRPLVCLHVATQMIAPHIQICFDGVIHVAPFAREKI